MGLTFKNSFGKIALLTDVYTETAIYNVLGRMTRVFKFHSELLDWSGYSIYCYSDGHTPEVEINKNNPVGNNNQGDFNLNVNIPTDSINNGNITITLHHLASLRDSRYICTL